MLFLFLDSYYLGLERFFRDIYTKFVMKLHSNTVDINDVFTVNIDISLMENITLVFRALRSISIWPFYGLLSVNAH